LGDKDTIKGHYNYENKHSQHSTTKREKNDQVGKLKREQDLNSIFFLSKECLNLCGGYFYGDVHEHEPLNMTAQRLK
jgi:hypothetical protein